MPSPLRILLLSFFPVTILLVAALALCRAASGAGRGRGHAQRARGPVTGQAHGYCTTFGEIL